MEMYKCPCCGNLTLTECPPGSYEICSICGWEDDDYQYNNPDYDGGANILSLNAARKEYFEKKSSNLYRDSNKRRYGISRRLVRRND